MHGYPPHSPYLLGVGIESFYFRAHSGLHHVKVCLRGFRQLKDEDVQLLLDSCPSLSILSVADCTTLGSLILSSKQLKTLDVSRCIHISEMSLEMPGKHRCGLVSRREEEEEEEKEELIWL